jgi:hypothetical protein
MSKFKDVDKGKHAPIKGEHIFCMIPNSTMISIMGEKRWGDILEAVRRKYKTCKVRMEYTKPPTMRAFKTDGSSVLLGNMAQVESWAKKLLKGK